VGVDAVGTTGISPNVAAGGAVAVAVRSDPVSVALEGRVDDAVAPASPSPASSAAVTSWLYAGSVVPCLHVATVGVCGVALAGSLQASSSHVVSSRSDAAFYAAVGGRLGMELPLSRTFALRLHADLLVDVRPAEFRVDQIVWTTPPFAGAGAGLLARFP
jgi:hypothetical protein